MDKVVHFEVPADDLERAQQFYKNVFDWRITKVPMPGGDYYMVNTVETDEQQMPKEAGAINGGMMQRTPTAPSPVIVIKVSSVDDYMGKVKKGGGTVVTEKQQVGDMGLYARVKDTEGNVIGLWQDLE